MLTKGLAGLALVVGVGSALYWGADVGSASRYEALREDRRSAIEGTTPIDVFASPGIVRPRVQPASAAEVAGSEEVIGVEAEGRSRAYRLSALRPIPAHIVNDVLGDVPVSVTYCDLTDCLRTLTGDGRGAPLELGQAGYFRGRGMLLDVGGHSYLQQSGEPTFRSDRPPAFPYRPISSSRTTWADWKAAHPDTDIYVGPPRPNVGPGPKSL